ncbi:heparinase II/III domain-containing protein [Clostridium oryzae]|uniref:heparinase II/III domain-containing protein n=1 Tax=Clostridium oryzae TaxID=1450648 RepID=UPI001A9A37AF|nr:heparinase II/III family protein [Clostridium oryzae]
MNLQTPAYEYFNGNIGTPPFGDHALSGGSEFGIYGIYLEDIEKLDKVLADRMYHTWSAAGKPFKKFWGESIALENIMGKGDSYKPSSELHLTSCKNFVNAGIYIFRKNFGKKDQSYFAIMSSPKFIGHGHLDQGSFIIYKNSIPIVMDSGIEGYFDNSTSWHISSYAHACMQFSTKRKNIEKSRNSAVNLSAGTYSLERGWVDVPRQSKVLSCEIGGWIESIEIEILNSEGTGIHTRKVYYIKEFDIYVIQDIVKDFEGNILFNLPVAAKYSAIEDNQVYSKGAYEVDLQIVFLSSVKDIKLDKGRSTLFFPGESKNMSMMDYIRATADAKDGFLAVIYPKENNQKKLQIIKKDAKNMVIFVENKSIKLSLKDNEIDISLINEIR